MVEPPKTSCVATLSAATSTASVIIPDSSAIATRAATSLPNACEATSTTSAPFALATCDSASAAAATPCFAISSDSTIAIDEIGPCVRVAASAAPFPTGANTTAQT